MKNSLTILMTAMLASLITIALFKLFEKPETIIVRERIPATRFPMNPPSPQSTFSQSYSGQRDSAPPPDILKVV